MPPSARPETPPTVWRRGRARMLDYGYLSEQAAAGPPLLFIPSLINRSYILDLTPRRSLLRFLAARGFRPLLIDWGAPGESERGYTLEDYICGTLSEALTAARRLSGQRVSVVGYCMGGLLALALAQLRPAAVKSLLLLATPWDFAAMDRGKVRLLQAMMPNLQRLLEVVGVLPVDVLQAMFASLDPQLTPRKFQAFAALEGPNGRAGDFTALEDWVNDGVPLAASVARETMGGWYVDNLTGRGQWRVGGQNIRPEKIAVASLVVVPERDRIVPPATVIPLGEKIPWATTLRVDAGHIGMIVGSGSRKKLCRPLEKWLRTNA